MSKTWDVFHRYTVTSFTPHHGYCDYHDNVFDPIGVVSGDTEMEARKPARKLFKEKIGKKPYFAGVGFNIFIKEAK